MNNYVMNYAKPGTYHSGNIIVSITVTKPGIYLLIGYNHNQNNLPVWLDNIADQNDFGYMMLDHNSCIAKLFYVADNHTFALYNLAGQDMSVNMSTYLCAIRLNDL